MIHIMLRVIVCLLKYCLQNIICTWFLIFIYNTYSVKENNNICSVNSAKYCQSWKWVFFLYDILSYIYPFNLYNINNII